MRKTLIPTAAIAAIVVAALFIKAFVAPPKIANAQASTSSVSTYDLHVAHPNMKGLPVQDAPLP